MSTILVTGGAGYVGSMVSRELLAGVPLVVVADALVFVGAADPQRAAARAEGFRARI